MTETVQLYHREHGAGFPVVLVYGFPFDHTIWAAQQAALSASFRIITPDLRGHGQSQAPDGVYPVDVMAEDILALLDWLEIERAVWAGHSMGGYITMAALRRAPERIAGVALVATHPFPDSDAKRAGRIQSAEAVQRQGTHHLISDMIDVLFAPTFAHESIAAQKIVNIMSRTSPAGVAGALRGMAARPDSVATLQAVRVPAVVIGGAEDQLIPRDMLAQTVAALPGATLVTIPAAGHLPMVEQPDATTAALYDFLAANFGAGD